MKTAINDALLWCWCLSPGASWKALLQWVWGRHGG